jgi:hypothetical protein
LSVEVTLTRREQGRWFGPAFRLHRRVAFS